MWIFAAIVLVMQALLTAEIVWYGRRVQPLPAPRGGQRLPKLSVIIPALNEEGQIRGAVESLLAQDYPDFEVILVDDRSTDMTGAIIDALAALRPSRIKAVHVTELPQGWLGKNHALYQGYLRSTGEWLLFTDADVHFRPGALRAAVHHAEREGFDHLVLAIRLVGRSLWLRAFIAYFMYAFWVGNRPYHANDPKRLRSHIGLGAFNLVRRAAYEQAGTHRAISLRPDDDMMLGMRIKRCRLRQHLSIGTHLASVEWYPTLGEAVRGLEKNMFAAQGYSMTKVLGLSVLMVGVCFAPWVLAPFAGGWATGALLGVMLLQGFTLCFVAGHGFGSFAEAIPVAILFPFLTLMTLYVFWRSTYKNLRQGGVNWRGTLYPLALLKSQTGEEGLD